MTRTSLPDPRPSGGETRDAGRRMARTRTGCLVPRESLEPGVNAAAALEARLRRRAMLVLGGGMLLALGALLVVTMGGAGQSSPRESILRDAGYVLAERKGIGLRR